LCDEGIFYERNMILQQIWQNILQTSPWLWVLVGAAALLNFAAPAVAARFWQGERLQRATLVFKLTALAVAIVVCILVLTERI